MTELLSDHLRRVLDLQAVKKYTTKKDRNTRKMIIQEDILVLITSRSYDQYGRELYHTDGQCAVHCKDIRDTGKCSGDTAVTLVVARSEGMLDREIYDKGAKS